jgi:hypothetical protein
LVANALSGGKPAHNKTGKTIAPPAPAMELIKPAMKATLIKPIKSVSDNSIFCSSFLRETLTANDLNHHPYFKSGFYTKTQIKYVTIISLVCCIY